MGLIDKRNLKSEGTTVEKHPLLGNGDVPINVRQMYFQGCVLALLERDNGNLTTSDKAKLKNLGADLQIAKHDIEEAISTMSGMKSAEDQEEFLHEFFLVLAGEEYTPFFMNDFEALLKGDGELSEDARQTLDYFGRGLTGSQDWRKCCVSREEKIETVLAEGYITLLSDNPKDKKNAFECFMKAAEQDSAEAQNMVGMCYLRGDGVVADIEKALLWIKKAAENGDANAQNNLADAYQEGQGVTKNIATSIKWRRKSVEQGHIGALIGLALNYYTGNGVAEDHGKAFELELKAAESGEASAQNFVGISYLLGDGVDEDECKSTEWFEKAAKQGFAEAQNMLGMAYSNGRGVEADAKTAFKWFKKSADQGCATGQLNLGLALKDGNGCRVDERLAAKWFRKAAKQGNADAQLQLGLCYESGCGVKKDESEAEVWYRKSAENGNAYAKMGLGVVLNNRAMVNGDVQLAREGLQLLRQAKENGVEEAQESIDNAWNPDVVNIESQQHVTTQMAHSSSNSGASDELKRMAIYAGRELLKGLFGG